MTCIKEKKEEKKGGKWLFEESDLIFRFNKDWIIKKYDAHQYYKTISGLGMKGVDFIGIYQYSTVVFIEVKNYRIRYSNKGFHRLYDVFDHPGALAEKIQQKFSDSAKGVIVVHNFLNKRWWLKPIFPLLKRIPYSKWTKSDNLFWIRSRELIRLGKVKNLLLIETEDAYPGYSAKNIHIFKTKLQKQINPNLLISAQDHPFKKALSIEILNPSNRNQTVTD